MALENLKSLNDDLQVEANKSRLISEPKVLREYFGIEYQEKLGNILHQFTEYLCCVLKVTLAELRSRKAIIYSE